MQPPRSVSQPPSSKIPTPDRGHAAELINYENMARADTFEPLSINTESKKKPQPPATPLLAAATPEEFVGQSTPNEFEVIEEYHDVVITREAGQGLGLSIAGGKGSPPYKGTDEVHNITQR